MLCVLVLVVLAGGVASQTQDPSELTPSLCSSLILRLQPLKKIKLSELRGHWIALNKATFGTDGISTFTQTDPGSEVDFNINLDHSGSKLKTVPDCINQELSNITEDSVTVTSSLFFEDSRNNEVVVQSYKVDKEQKGLWKFHQSSHQGQETEDVLILSVDPNKYMVLATCHNNFRPSTRSGDVGGLRTEVLTVARHRANISPKQQLELISEVANKLGERSLVAAQFSTECKKNVKSGTAGLVSAVGIVVLLSAVLVL